MTERALHSTLKTSLKNDDPFLYCHLIKFERAIATESFKPAEAAHDYVYISDASFDIAFDDGSKDISDNSNGSQIYRANRVKSVGTVSETTEAKVSNISINISTESIDTATTTNQTLSFAASGDDFTVTTNDGDNFTDLGFLIGDKITVKNLVGATTNHNLQGIITASTGTTITVKKIGSVTFNAASSTQNFKVEATPDEVSGLVQEEFEDDGVTANTTYAGYINREVFIYKAHLDPNTRAIIGAPYLLFRGIINKVKLVEDPTKSSQCTWTLSSHWGDFQRVVGRVTSDSTHRALSGNGEVDTKALIRPEYASDLGFMHSEKAINIIAIYQAMETRYKMKSSGLFGLKKKLVEYQVEVDRDVDLRFNLEAKHLPVIYGVQRTDSIPIFADTRKLDSSEIYAVYAICEGEISGLYDIYINGQGRVCIDQNDSDTRGTQNGDKTIDVVCKGRADKGDTLTSSPAFTGGALAYIFQNMSAWTFGGFFGLGALFASLHRNLNQAISATQKSEAGVTHEAQHIFEDPIDGKLIFHAGRPYQKANDLLVQIADTGAGGGDGFKLQADLDDNKGKYWTTAHRLLDTAYVVARYDISEGEVEIPELDFVVRGKEIEQYNYDYSYKLHADASQTDNQVTTQKAKAAFQPGSKVDVYVKAGSGTKLADSLTIMDVFNYKDGRERTHTKFRFSANPLGTTTGRDFRIVPEDASGTGSDFLEFSTYDYSTNGTEPSNTGIDSTIEVAVGTSGNVAICANTAITDGKGIDITIPDGTVKDALSHLSDKSPIMITFLDADESADNVDILNNKDVFQVTFNTSNGKIENVGNTQEGKPTSGKLVLVNALKLHGSTAEGTTNDKYVGQNIKVTRTLSDGSKVNFLSEIAGYKASERIAILGERTAIEASNTTATNTTVTPIQSLGFNTTYTFQVTNLANLVSGMNAGTVYHPQATDAHNIPEGTTVTNVSTSNNTITFSNEVALSAYVPLNFVTGSDAADFGINPAPGKFITKAGDKYEILSLNGDKKVSINPAIQLLDYLTNERYGRGLDISKDIDLESFKDSARQCDTRSDITLFLHRNYDENDIAVGDEYYYEYGPTSKKFWQGTVKSKTLRSVNVLETDGVTTNSVDMVEVTFTDCIGKLITKWEDWKTFEAGQLMWKVHEITESGKVVKRSKVHIAQTTSYTTLGGTQDIPMAGASEAKYFGNIKLTKLSGSGASFVRPYWHTHTSDTTAGGDTPMNSGLRETNASFDGNPLIKKFNSNTSYPTTTGYSLYDSDAVKYWRYMGWQEKDQREVTRHQTNATIRTEDPVFSTVNSMLEHFNGILRYVEGKYQLDVQSKSGTYTTNDIRKIDENDIIGAISVEDTGLKGSANSVSVTIRDPQVRYDNRSVTFFNSDYLKEDRGVPKKKDIKIPFITNYFNARINAKQYLEQSRTNKKINFKIGPKGVILVAGDIIKITYPRFGWNEKMYRISNLNFTQDCLVQVTAEEHSDRAFIVEETEEPVFEIGEVTPGVSTPIQAPGAPSNLTATGGEMQVALSWANNVRVGAEWRTEILAHTSDAVGSATVIADLSSDVLSFTDTNGFSKSSNTTKYYWVRHKKSIAKPSGQVINARSVTHPTTNGVAGTGTKSATTNQGVAELFRASETSPTIPSAISNFPNITFTFDPDNGITGAPNPADINGSGEVLKADDSGTGWFIKQPTRGITESMWRVHKSFVTTDNTFTLAPSAFDNSIQEIVTPSGTENAAPAINVSGTNLEHAFIMNDAGAVSNDFSCSFDINKGNQAYTFAASGTADNTFGIEVVSVTGGITTGVISAATITAGGSGYSSAPTVTFAAPGGSGTTATGTAVLSGNAVASITITNPGSGYTSLPAISFSGGGGSSAAATAVAGEVLISNSGVVTIANTANILDTVSVEAATIKLKLFDRGNSNTKIQDATISLTKERRSTRDGITITLTMTSSQATAFKGTLTNAVADAVKEAVIASDLVRACTASGTKRIVPGDRITVKSGNIVATRIYTGGPSGTAKGSADADAVATDFSSVVAAEFDGSVIVDGTLSADKLIANTTTSNQINVGSILKVGTSGSDSGAKIYSFDKGTGITDSSAGFYMDGSGDFAVGGSGGSLVFDASAGSLVFDGTFKIGSSTVNNSYISGLAPVQSVNGGTGSVTITAAGLNISHSNVSGLGSLATANSVAVGSVTGLGSLATANSVNALTQITNLLGSATNQSTFDSDASDAAPIQSVNGSVGTVSITADSLNISSANISDVDATAGMLKIDTSVTDVSAGKIILTSGDLKFTTSTNTATYRPQNSIVLDTTANNNVIEIRDGSVVRVRIGKLS